MGVNPGGPTGFDTTAERLGDGTIVLSVDGELDLDTASRFKAKLELAVGQGPSPVIVDLTGCDFVDSTGLRVLVQAGDPPDRSGPLTLIVPHANILKALEIARLEDKFVIRPTLAAALERG